MQIVVHIKIIIDQVCHELILRGINRKNSQLARMMIEEEMGDYFNKFIIVMRAN